MTNGDQVQLINGLSNNTNIDHDIINITEKGQSEPVGKHCPNDKCRD